MPLGAYFPELLTRWGFTMADPYFTPEWVEKYRKLLLARDMEGLRRMKFGRVIYHIRRSRSRSLSQKRAAELAKVTRPQWNRYENGEALPRPATILRIADKFGEQSSILLRAAGYDVPKEYFQYDSKRAHERLEEALKESKDKAEFLTHMEAAWVERELHTACVEVGLPDQIRVQFIAGLVAYINQRLTKYERVQLAVELVQSSDRPVDNKAAGDLGDFYAQVGERIREYISPADLWVPVENDFIL